MEKDQVNLPDKVVLIGGSAGSLEVLLQVLPQLGNIDTLALIVILHRKNSDDNLLENLLRAKTKLKVKEIEDKTPISPGEVYVAPADYHLLFEAEGFFSLDISEKVNYSRPSIDVAFESAAAVFGSKLVAVLLSGANADGTAGLLAIKKAGGSVVIQSPETAEVPFMPQHAINHVPADYILPTLDLAAFIDNL